MSSNLEQEIGRKVQALSDAEQQRLLNIIDQLLGQAQPAQPSTA
jgi:hypothetical protein